MGILYAPQRGEILVCDYPKDFTPPEMVKSRLVVVLAPRLPHRDRLCSVVPLSTTPPQKKLIWQPKIDLGRSPPSPWEGQFKWAKADMIDTFAYSRLNKIKEGRDHLGKRKYISLRLPKEEMAKILEGVRNALRMDA